MSVAVRREVPLNNEKKLQYKKVSLRVIQNTGKIFKPDRAGFKPRYFYRPCAAMWSVVSYTTTYKKVTAARRRIRSFKQSTFIKQRHAAHLPTTNEAWQHSFQ
ncbi:hypothetical protein ALO98_200317 [Pseudomonas syringae pv. tagetis]|nr:hypothetical protein ALO98_200317 [Pseudomonas syringae pv. tagetis]